jgi:long-chain acyl-CoA synthetase
MMADLALMMAGCVSIPIYPTLTASAIEPILRHSNSKAVFVGKLDDFAAQQPGIPEHLLQIGFATYGIQVQHRWEDWRRQYTPLIQLHNWQPDELFTIMYTSGTTGHPKGVMHTCGNIDTVLQTAMQELSLPRRPVLFSYLPLSHIAEKVGIEMNGLYNGGSFSFAENLETFAANLEDTQPHCFFAVPRIWSKFREGILKKFSEKKLRTLLGIPLLGNLLRKTIRHKLGLARVTHIFSGAAPLSLDNLKWFNRLGITIYQAYGMTEDCVYAHFERPGIRRMGSVGKPLPGLQTKISPEGELLVKSPSLMKGYYKEPELTATMFDAEGYLRTGDKVEYDHEGFLFITGRIKDQFKTDKGKYISPAPIELQLTACELIEQVCVVGMGIPQPIALITLNEAGRRQSREAINYALIILLQQVNRNLEQYEKLEKAVVMKENWTVENGLLTPTLKVKRNEVERLHQPYYAEWFHHSKTVIWE